MDLDYTTSIENPFYAYEFPGEGYYYFTLYAVNENNCIDSMTHDLYVNFEKGLFVPNALYPDHSDWGVSHFTPVAIGLKEYHVMVFDTYGNLLWESTEIDNEGKPTESWDGTLNGNLLPEDVYVWKVYGKFKDDDVWEGKEYPNEEIILHRTGTVTLIR